MKKLLCLMGGAMLIIGVKAQHVVIKPYNIGDRVTEFPLNKMVNYNVDSTTISSFGNKLVILDFWGTHCGSCIKALPEENTLQKIFQKEVQFILITSEDETIVSEFLERFKKSGKELDIPIITSDILIQQMFQHGPVPHFVWLGPDGMLLAQTSSSMLNEAVIRAALADIKKRKEGLRASHFPEKYFHFSKPNEAQMKFFEQYKN